MNRAVRPDTPAGRAAHPESTTYDVEDGMVKRALALAAVVAVMVAVVAVMVAAALLVVAGRGWPPSHAVPRPSPQPPPCPPG